MSPVRTATPWPQIMRAGEFLEHRRILRSLYDLAGGWPAIDLGCGEAHVTRDLNCVLVDLVPRPSLPVDRQVVQLDIRDAPAHFKSSHFNVAIMTDVIEHLTEHDGRKLLAGLERITDAIVLFTPLGKWRVVEGFTDNPDDHRSGWYPMSLYSAGWEVLSYPEYHQFEAGETLGAFWAWKFFNKPTPPAEAVLQMAGVEL